MKRAVLAICLVMGGVLTGCSVRTGPTPTPDQLPAIIKACAALRDPHAQQDCIDTELGQ